MSFLQLRINYTDNAAPFYRMVAAPLQAALARHGQTRWTLARGWQHGIGQGKQGFLPMELGGSVDLMRQIKQALDPDNILNPGKIFSARAALQCAISME